jgi:hypothetical protein
MIKRYLEDVFRGPDRSCCSPYAREIIAPVNLRDALGYRDGDELDHAPMTLEQEAKSAKALRTFRYKDKAPGSRGLRVRQLQ